MVEIQPILWRFESIILRTQWMVGQESWWWLSIPIDIVLETQSIWV